MSRPKLDRSSDLTSAQAAWDNAYDTVRAEFSARARLRKSLDDNSAVVAAWPQQVKNALASRIFDTPCTPMTTDDLTSAEQRVRELRQAGDALVGAARRLAGCRVITPTDRSLLSCALADFRMALDEVAAEPEPPSAPTGELPRNCYEDGCADLPACLSAQRCLAAEHAERARLVGRLQAERKEAREWAAQLEVDWSTDEGAKWWTHTSERNRLALMGLLNELHEARTEVDRLTRERDEARGDLDHLREVNAANLATIDRLTRERDEARRERRAYAQQASWSEAAKKKAERERDTLRALLERCATVFRAGKMFPEHESNLLTDITAAIHQPKEQQHGG